MPNLAIIESIKKIQPTTKISYIGSKDGLESKLVFDYNIDFYSIHTGKLRRYFDWQNFIDIFKVPYGFFEALKIIKKIKPDLVFSKGGYVSLPVVLAAFILKIPIVIHESDVIPGLTTKITSRLATKIWSDHNIANLSRAKNFVKIKLPLREFLFNGDRTKFLSKYNLNNSKQNLLVMGGSLGAKVINDFIYKNIDSLTSEFNVIHICGKGKLQNITHLDYQSFEYLDAELSDAYATADFILSRAGASAIAEFDALNKKVILVPLDLDQSRGEQIQNAKSFCAKLYVKAVTLYEAELTIINFKSAILKLKQLELSQNNESNPKDSNLKLQESVVKALFSIPTNKNKL